MADPQLTPHHRHRAWFSVAVLVVACASMVTRAVPVDAGDGSSGYEGVFSSTAPSGYAPAPAAHPPSTTVRYSFTVSNTALVPASFSATLYTQRLTSVRGTDVSSGDPAFSERDVLTGPTSGDPVVMVGPVPGSGAVFLPGETDSVDMMVSTAGCGYLLVWAGSSADRSPGTVLNDGATRVTGCAGATASPQPSPSPSSDPGSAPTPNPPAAPAAPASSPPHPSSTPQAGASPSRRPSSTPAASVVPPHSPGSGAAGPGVPRPPLSGGSAGSVDQSNPFPIHSGASLPGIKTQRAVVLGAVVAAGIVLSLLLWLLALRRRARDARRSGGPPASGLRLTHRG